MTYFYAWETVDLEIGLEDAEALQNLDTVCVSIAQGYRYTTTVVNIEDVGIDDNEGTITVHLDQEDTGKFREGIAVVQVNFYYTDSERDTTEQAVIEVRDNLLRRVMA